MTDDPVSKRFASLNTATLIGSAKGIFPGLLVAVLVALAAQFLSEHYGAPAMLMALLLGIALNFLSEEGRCQAGIAFSVRYVLRLGVALLGARISVGILTDLGAPVIAVVLGAIIFTVLVGLIGARFLGRGWRFAVLTGGAVAICGASAAIAISAVLPKNDSSERNLIFTVLGVTVLSTVAMIAYPVIATLAGLSPVETGVFLGGTIHDVAQVVGAGFSVSNETGEIATIVKLMRVAMLAPVVLLLSIYVRTYHKAAASSSERPPLVPGFLIGFFVLAAINSAGLMPSLIGATLSEISRWALIVSIAAVGMKTSLKSIFDVGGQAITLIVVETVFLAGFILLALFLLR